MAKLLPLIIGQIKTHINQSNITVVCIDGPTAAGKTILADSLGKEIEKQLDVNVEFFRLDWTLLSRVQRKTDLTKLMENQYDFHLEGELHMNLNLFRNFLKKINSFKNKNYHNQNDKNFTLRGLYSREKNGKCEGEYNYDFSKKTVVICEGHYTSRNEYFKYIDLNICLLSDKGELLKRKLDRVKSYRSSKEASDYFWKIDVPSFSHHLSRYYKNIDLFIDNTDYLNPRLSSIADFKEWFNENNVSNPTFIKYEEESKVDFNLIFNNIFSSSQINQIIDISSFKDIVLFYKEIDKVIASRLQENIKDNQLGINEILCEALKKINVKIQKSKENKNVEIIPIASSSLYDVYNRKIPVSFGISVISESNKKFYIDFNIYMYSCSLSIFWEGGAYEIRFRRALTTIKDENEKREVTFRKLIIKKDYFNNIEDPEVKLYTPTNFCIAEFLNNIKFKIIFTGREHETTSISEILGKVIQTQNSVISHRLSNFSEIKFYLNFLNSIGINAVNIGNYIIAINTTNNFLKNSFKNWIKSWINENSQYLKDQFKYDSILKDELNEARDFARNFTKNFFIVDSFLFLKESKNNIKSEIDDLRIMLKSSNRSLRKRAFQYIIKNEPSLQLVLKDFLSIYKIKNREYKNETFQLSELPFFYPTILAELYMWMHLRGDKSAILAANIYDIDNEESIDIEGILEASINKNTPIVLQSSFNAIGQKEIDNGTEFFGYLKLESGPNQLVDSCISSALKLKFTDDNNIPFYGIGLDHVDHKNDKPSGRANRFITSALKTGNITHIVLDGSSLFNAKTRKIDDIEIAYKEVAKYAVSLIKSNESIFLTDLEYCVGEMNYIGNSKLAMIPNSREINLFVALLQDLISKNGIGHFNCRPSLFIGNVGTIHHDKDLNNDVNSAITFSWVESVKNKNFISAVLHGTTNSQKDVLINSTNGCHKVNVAGDFLKIYQSSLPENLEKKYREFAPDSKLFMHEIRKLKKTFTKKEKNLIKDNIRNKSYEFMDSLNSPILTNRDKAYFHRCSYKFPDEVIDLIISAYENSKINPIQTIPKSLKKDLFFSASMIEVPLEDSFCEKADALIASGISHFHIDVGDGNFISRKFSGLAKLGYLSSLKKNLKLHTHLMVKDPLILKNNNSYIDQYINAGSTSIALHRRSFSSDLDLKVAIDYIKNKDCRPGLLIEISENNLIELWERIKYINVNWVVVMGVPVGYGGQLFQSSCLKKINFLRKMSINESNNSLDIEIDGGLNFSNLKQCADAGANIFAGWSIIKEKSIDSILRNYSKVMDQLKT